MGHEGDGARGDKEAGVIWGMSNMEHEVIWSMSNMEHE